MFWIENWLTGRVQRVVISDAVSGWKPVTTNVPQGFLLGPDLLNIFINYLNEGIESTNSHKQDESWCVEVEIFKTSLDGALSNMI